MYTSKDIGIVIPTYNRAEDVDKTLSFLLENDNIPAGIYVVDQSPNDKTRQVVENAKKSFDNINFIKCKIASTAKASNIGIEKAKKKHKIVLMLDDDVDCFPGFLDGLLGEFNSNNKIYGVAAWGPGNELKNYSHFLRFIQKIILNFFLLPSKINNKFMVLGPYGNTGSYIRKQRISDAQWLPGVNMCYRREVFEDYKIPESKGYNLLQDIDVSYHTFRKYGKGSLVITDKAEVRHRGSQVERYPNSKLAFVSQEDRFIFYYRYFHNFPGTLKLIWSIFGLILLKSLSFIFKPNKKNFLDLKYFISSLSYNIKNRENIKKGEYRLFLDNDYNLSI